MITTIDIVTKEEVSRLRVASFVREHLADGNGGYLSPEDFKINTVVTADHFEAVELLKEVLMSYPMDPAPPYDPTLRARISKLLKEHYGVSA